MRSSFSALFLFLGMLCYGQVSEMRWGAEFKAKGYIEFIGENNGSVYTYRSYKRSVFLEKYEVESMSNSFSLLLDFDLAGRKERLNHEFTYILSDGSLVILASRYDKSTDLNTLYGTLISESGQIAREWSQLAEITATSKRNTGNFTVNLSPDKKKLLIAANLPYDKRESPRYQMYLYSAQLGLLWEQEFVLPYEDKEVSLGDFHVDNDGISHVLVGIAPGSRKERKALINAGQETFSRKLITFKGESDELREYDVKLEDRTIHTALLTQDTAQNLIITGFYVDDHGKRFGPHGVFFIKMQAGKEEAAVVNAQEFSPDFFLQVTGQKKRDIGLGIPTDFIIRQIVSTLDGGISIVAEEYYVREHCTNDPRTGTQNCYYTYHYNSIMVIRMGPDGKILWNSVIPKLSFDQSHGYHLSYALMITDNALHLVFLDDKRNFNELGGKVPLDETKYVKPKKSVAVVASIQDNGDISYSILYDTKTSKIRMRPKISSRLNRTTLIVLGETKKGGTCLGKITF